MQHYVFKTYQDDTFDLESLSPSETALLKTNTVGTIREYSETSKVFELYNGKALAQTFFDNSGILFPSKAVYNFFESKAVFLKLGKNMQLIGFQMLDASDLQIVDQMILEPIGKTCEGDGFLLTNGLFYTKEEYGRYGYIFQSREELTLYCAKWVKKQFR